MKTLDEIIARQDYVRANAALVERAREIADLFASKFNELFGAWDSRESDSPSRIIKVNGHSYFAKCNTYRDNCELLTDGYRFVRVKEIPHDYSDYISLNSKKYGKQASWQDYIEFLNDAKDILTALDVAETELVKETARSIKNAENI